MDAEIIFMPSVRSNAIGGTKAGTGYSICVDGDTSTSSIQKQRCKSMLHLLQ